MSGCTGAKINMYNTGEALPTLARVEISNPGSHIASAPCPSHPPIHAGFPPVDCLTDWRESHRFPSPHHSRPHPMFLGAARPCAPAPEQQPVPGTAAPFPFAMCAEHRRRHHLHATFMFSPSLANPALVIALQLDPPINKTDVVKSGSSHCQQLRWILWSQVDGPSHCFDQSRPSLHPVLPSQDRPTWFDRPLPPSRYPTVSTELSPRRLLSPFKFPRPWDRCDRPRLLDCLAAVPPFCSSHPCTSCHPSVLVSPPRVSFFSSCESHVFLRLAVRRVSLPCSCRSPPLASVSAGPRRRISPLRPAPSHPQRSSRRVVRRWQRALVSAACRLQKGVDDLQKRLGLAFSCSFLI